MQRIWFKNKHMNIFSSYKKNKAKFLSAWSWIPSLYFAEGLPNVLVSITAVLMYKDMGLSNEKAVLYTSWLYLPWVIKPFWSPFVDMIRTKRWWVLLMQMFMGAAFAGVAFSIHTSFFIASSLALLWLIALFSATHDIAADGFYMLGLDLEQQSFFVGIRSIFYKFANIFGQGVLVLFAGYMELRFNDKALAWTITFYIAAALLIAAGLYHKFILPRPASDRPNLPRTTTSTGKTLSSFSIFLRTFRKFFTKKDILKALLFILLFRLGEAQLGKLSQLFMKDPISEGGLGLDNTQVGFLYGTIGAIALLAGGSIGGILVSRDGLKKWFWPMIFSMNLPNIVYVYMAATQPSSLLLIEALVCLEQFGYGFGLTAFLMYLIYFSRGKDKTSNYAICTGLMALGMMLPGMGAGWIQKELGYTQFFIWICLCTLPGFLIAATLKIEKNFGKKEKENNIIS